MNFIDHSSLNGEHAFLSASKYHWVNYDSAKLTESYMKFRAAQRGTELHDFARHCIELKQKLPKLRKSLNMYVNDAIGYRMQPEQVLFYSENAFGTADSICFRDGLLRIHDFKSGVSPVKMTQLEIYAAYFCLEYLVDPNKIEMELRIYQNNEILVHKPLGKDIKEIMNKIVAFDKEIQKLKLDEEE